jgi:hypothetical protein
MKSVKVGGLLRLFAAPDRMCGPVPEAVSAREKI